MNSPLCYIGGKSQLSNIITQKLPSHKSYIEVFAGAAWVFFRKNPSKYEVINDRDGDLVSFYRVLQNHLEEFIKQFKWLLMSRQWWEEWNKQLEVGGLTDIQKAARYYYVQRQCFGGRVRGRTFGTAPDHAPKINLLRIEEELSEVHMRLSNIMIENLDYKDLINRYDRLDNFFYLDPPYYKAPFYKYNMELDDFKIMNELLKSISGKFLLSINDHPQIREVFKDFIIEDVNVKYSIQKEGELIAKELLIRNYEKYDGVEVQRLNLY